MLHASGTNNISQDIQNESLGRMESIFKVESSGAEFRKVFNYSLGAVK